MHAIHISKGRTLKDVYLTDTAGEPDSAVINAALAAANETRSSVFGWAIQRTDNTALVVLHID